MLQGGTLIDGRGGAPIEDAVVVVRGDRISAVGRRGQIPVPAGANVIQTNGRTILPGLIDMHLHLRGWKIPLYLAHGVTTVGDIHSDTAWIIAQRAAQKSGVMQGPRFFVSGARVLGPLLARARREPSGRATSRTWRRRARTSGTSPRSAWTWSRSIPRSPTSSWRP